MVVNISNILFPAMPSAAASAPVTASAGLGPGTNPPSSAPFLHMMAPRSSLPAPVRTYLVFSIAKHSS